MRETSYLQENMMKAIAEDQILHHEYPSAHRVKQSTADEP